MGYRKTVRHLTISLKDHAEYGADDVAPQAVLRGKNLDEYLRLMGYTDTEEGDDRTGIVRQLEEFAGSLVSWNLEAEDGTPLPCTRKAFFDIDNDLALAMATEWLERLGGKVNAPLESSSPSGEPSQVASIPMETLPDLPLPTSVPA